MSRLTGEQVRALRKQARCPDCPAEITVNRTTRRVDLRHHDTCPMLHRLQRNGALATLALTPAAGQNIEDFADAVADVATRLAQTTGRPVRLRTDPYKGLPL